jgi:hypothetical protein
MLAGSRDLIVSLLGHNLTGQVTLSNDLAEPLRLGNLVLKAAAGRPAGISMYALYLSGKQNDLTVTGRSHICELMMHDGGRLTVAGTPSGEELSIGCTTLDLTGEAQLDLRDVHLGRPSRWPGEREIGEATVKDEARLTGEHVSVRNVRFRTTGAGRVELDDVRRLGTIEVRQEGGSVRIAERDND